MSKAGKALRRLWMKYAMRGVGGADNYSRLDRAYALDDPWNMDSALERSRFEATNAMIERAFGRVGNLLEIGCGEGHQSAYLIQVAEQLYGIDVSARAIERARIRVPRATFAACDLASQPWGDAAGRFDLVVACEVLYYIKDIPATLTRMRRLGRGGFVTFFAPAMGLVSPHIADIPGLHKDWMQAYGTTWLVVWWRTDATCLP